jgi:hypothetical protein
MQESLSIRQRAIVGRQLHASDAFKNLKPGAKVAVTCAVEKYIGADGYFWPNVDEWADAAGMKPTALKRAVLQLCEAKVLTRQPYLRPPGAGSHGGKQGASTYRLAPEFLLQGGPKMETPQGSPLSDHLNLEPKPRIKNTAPESLTLSGSRREQVEDQTLNEETVKALRLVEGLNRADARTLPQFVREFGAVLSAGQVRYALNELDEEKRRGNAIANDVGYLRMILRDIRDGTGGAFDGDYEPFEDVDEERGDWSILFPELDEALLEEATA